MNYPYANGVIKAIENNILDISKLQKLFTVPKMEFLKALIDLGYGSHDAKTLEELINIELMKTKALFSEIVPNHHLTDLFYFQNDAINIKALYKKKIFNIIQFDIYANGIISKETLEKVIFEEDYSLIDKKLTTLFQNINQKISNLDNPRLISTIIDQEIYNYLFSEIGSNKALLTYYQTKIDFSNILTFLRSRKLGWSLEQFQEMFIKGGKFNYNHFASIYHENEKQIIKSFYDDDDQAVSKGLQLYFEQENLNNLEKYFDEAMLKIMKAFRYDAFDIGPIIYYFLMKQAEAQNLRNIYGSNEPNLGLLLKY
ncbi:MAG TPA: V-type ATPase subunit [Bacilli bacterium]